MAYESIGDATQDEADRQDYLALTSWTGTAKPIAQITKVSEVVAYAAAGYKVCDKKGWDEAAALYYKAFVAARHGGSMSSLKEMLKRADRAADVARAASKPSEVIAPSNEVEVPEHIKSSGFMGGMPWWAIVGMLGAAIFLFKGKKGSTRKPSKRRKGRARRKSRSRSRRKR